MCGILHIKRFDHVPVRKMIEKRYRQQKERGTEGFGLVGVSGGNISDFYRATKEDLMLDYLDKMQAPEILLHHRNPTSTPNFYECAQPIIIEKDTLKYTYLFAHNGVIRNAADLKKAHEELGFVYRTEIKSLWRTTETNKDGAYHEYPLDTKFNDSESLAIELALSLDKEEKSDIGVVSPEGTIAFVGIQFEKNEPFKAKKLFWGRNLGNPLFFHKESYFFQISSVGKGGPIDSHVLYSYDYETNKFEERKFSIGVTVFKDEKHESETRAGYSWQAKPKTTPLLGPPPVIPFAPVSANVNDNLPKMNLIQTEEECLEAMMDVSSELATIDSVLSKSGLPYESRTYLVERQAVLEEAKKSIESKFKLLEIDTFLKKEVELSPRKVEEKSA